MRNVTLVGPDKNIPKISYLQFQSEEFQENLRKQQGLLVLFSNDQSCDKSNRCLEMLNVMSPSYRYFTDPVIINSSGSNDTEEETDRLERRLPVEALFVYLPYEMPDMGSSEVAGVRAQMESAKASGYISQFPNQNVSIWEKTMKVDKKFYASAQFFRYMKKMDDQELNKINDTPTSDESESATLFKKFT
jgi:hypothetical protein